MEPPSDVPGSSEPSSADLGPQDHPGGHLTVWERRTRIWAVVFAAVTVLATVPLAVAIGAGWVVGSGLVLAPAIGIYAWQTRTVRRRRALLRRPFPSEWEAVLQQEVVFYRALDAPDRQRFRRQLQVFLGEKRITGIKLEMDTTTRVLAAASAIIPIFGFPDWEWDQITEVLVYPNRFDGEFQFGDARGHDILGMVGTGGLNRLMILSKPDLITGFRNATAKRNVGIHEFAHLVDKTDGVIDGVPGVGLERGAVEPWIDLMRRKMAEIEAGKSDINRYALTNEAEFFAVTAEYFFQRPGLMRQKHPALHAALERVFRQNLWERVAAVQRDLARGRPHFGRNSPCPCGSGRKYKKCCLT